MEEAISSSENVWVWREDTNTLACVPKQDADILREYWSGQSKPARPLRSNHYDRNVFRSINNFNKLQDKLLHDTPRPVYRDEGDNSQVSSIGLCNIKQVALDYISEKHLHKMLIGAVSKFDTCLSLCCLDKLLLCSIRYFHEFLRIRQYDDVSDNAYKFLDSSSKGWEERVRQAEAGLLRMRTAIAQVYSSLLLCLGLDECLHHNKHGKQRTSKSLIDNQFYEALYDYLLFGVWVTFSRQHWEQIKASIGALFKSPFTLCLDRTPAPTHSGHTASIDFAKVGREEKGLIISVCKHKYARSKVMQVFLPGGLSASETSPPPQPLGQEPELEELLRLTENVGIFGSNLALFDPTSLEPLPERLRLSAASFTRSKLSSSTADS